MRRHSSSDASSSSRVPRRNSSNNPPRVSAPHTRSINAHDIHEDAESFFEVNEFLREDMGRGGGLVGGVGGGVDGISSGGNLADLLHVSPNKIQQQNKVQSAKKGECLTRFC